MRNLYLPQDFRAPEDGMMVDHGCQSVPVDKCNPVPPGQESAANLEDSS